jgi:hypothetical protein
MAKNELDLMLDHVDELSQVMVEHWKGNTATQIAKKLQKPRQRVVELIQEWQSGAARIDVIRNRAREALAGADAHYSSLIGKAYEVIEDAELANNLSAKTSAIKLISDMEAKRIDMLQKSGLLENKELADEMVATQKRQVALENILKDVVAKCDRCRPEVMRRLSDISENEVVVVRYNG